jgi:hypothetical protein
MFAPPLEHIPEPFGELETQTDMTAKSVSQIEKEGRRRAIFVAESLRLQQEKMVAHARLPALLKEETDVRVANIAKQAEVDRLAQIPKPPLPGRRRKPAPPIEPIDPEIAFDATRSEKVALLADFDTQISVSEGEIESLKQRIEDERELQHSLRDQMRRMRSPLPPNPREMGQVERQLHAEAIGLDAEVSYYDRRIAALQAIVDGNPKLRKERRKLKKKLKVKKETYWERLAEDRTRTVVLTTPEELNEMQSAVAQLKLDYGLTARKGERVYQAIRQARQTLKEAELYIPRSWRFRPKR